MRPKSAPTAAGDLVYVEESPEGSYLALARDGFDHVNLRSDGTTRRASVPDAVGQTKAALRTPEGVVQFLDSGQAVLCDVDAPNSTPELVTAPAPPVDVMSGMWWLGGNAGSAVAVSATANGVYLTQKGSGASDGSVSRVPTTGGTPTCIAQAQSQPHGIALAGGQVYWANEGSGEIMAAPEP